MLIRLPLDCCPFFINHNNEICLRKCLVFSCFCLRYNKILHFNYKIILTILHFQTVGVGIGINASINFNTSDRELLRGKHFVIGTIEVKPFSRFDFFLSIWSGVRLRTCSRVIFGLVIELRTLFFVFKLNLESSKLWHVMKIYLFRVYLYII